eukprot:TRINITY_DN22188_c0_g1_i1.p1 TRINITY_DN22188_c0_g1~~TRINITY_DN22188_c0_g1_i1.p1  ORF type:complete len:208 (-),score=6.48 TRINITY_DN22188_c0_g1_i1:60-683(-)
MEMERPINNGEKSRTRVDEEFLTKLLRARRIRNIKWSVTVCFVSVLIAVFWVAFPVRPIVTITYVKADKVTVTVNPDDTQYSTLEIDLNLTVSLVNPNYFGFEVDSVHISAFYTQWPIGEIDQVLNVLLTKYGEASATILAKLTTSHNALQVTAMLSEDMLQGSFLIDMKGKAKINIWGIHHLGIPFEYVAVMEPIPIIENTGVSTT